MLACVLGCGVASAQLSLNNGAPYLMNGAHDQRVAFSDFSSVFFVADSLSEFDAARGEGLVRWARYRLEPRQAFNTNTVVMDRLEMKDFPASGYYNDPEFRFRLDFVSPRTVRLRMLTSPAAPACPDELMLTGEVARDGWNTFGPTALPGTTGTPSAVEAYRPAAAGWTVSETPDAVTYTSEFGSLTLVRHPWQLILRDSQGKVLTRTRTLSDNETTQVKLLPFNFVKRGSDNRRSLNPVFSLMAGERLYGCGESATGLNKAGQVVNLFVTDPQGPETDQMYKPIPFWFSNRGYGMFLHTSAPVTCDFGASYVGASKLFMADEALDMFLFLGQPAEVLGEYTSLTGRSPMPPLWSFGTWMSRITYLTQVDGYEVARQLRSNRIPADVIHFDTGWFGTDWQCDYRFASDRFADPQKMIDDLLADGFHISLWQLPYFTMPNRFFGELVDSGLVVRNADGSLPYEDAALDFTNPRTVEWYQDKLSGLLEMGVGAIKADFGEGAPYDGFYHNGRGGLYEHNLYPLRYNKAVYDVTARVAAGRQRPDEGGIIWARSAWAGSQRYPLHWGGDAANTNQAMLSTLRAGMSFGLSGFSFWSHDIGGFVQSSPEDLYRRWLPFGFLTSHTRTHGAPPTEPWLYGKDFVKLYRACAEMKYCLMPYVYAQAKHCSETGLPMVRALLVEFPDDPSAWLIEDEYLFGNDMLVAPIFEGDDFYDQATDYGSTVSDRKGRAPLQKAEASPRTYRRQVYLPGTGNWIDYQTGKKYAAGWRELETAALPALILVREGAAIPHARLAQCTRDIDWNELTLKVYGDQGGEGLVYRPGDEQVQSVRAEATRVIRPASEP